MILLNFSKKLDSVGLEMVSQMCTEKLSEQIMLPIDADTTDGFFRELEGAFHKLNLTEEELCRDRVVVFPNRNQMNMQVLSAYLLGKTGKLPYFVVTHSTPFGLSARPEVSEVVDLQRWAEKAVSRAEPYLQ